MNILLVAPQPFYEERGTPIAVRLLAQALCAQGHRVDLVTYHLGADIACEGLRLSRIPRLPGIRRMPIGFSLQKLACDFFLFFKVARRMLRGRYDVVHCVEESIFFTLLLPKRGARVVYDMDSSMADQLVEKWPALRAASGLFNACERRAVRRADLVLPVCDALAEKVRAHAPGKPLMVLSDVALRGDESGPPSEDIRHGLPPDAVVALYVGNLESYQGVGLLIEALARTGPDARVHLIVIGGEARDVAALRAQAQALGVAGRCRMLGPRPVAGLAGYLRQADILVSPRLRGANTPMKIYSYMAAGRAILATNIHSHTQVLDDRTARLAAPTAEALAAGLGALAADEGSRRALGTAAAARAEERHTVAAYRRVVDSAYRRLRVSAAASPGRP